MTTETSLETLGASATNGGREASIGAEPKATVLAHDDVLSGRLQIKGSGQILGRFSGQVDCDGDLFIGPPSRRRTRSQGHRDRRVLSAPSFGGDPQACSEPGGPGQEVLG